VTRIKNVKKRFYIYGSKWSISVNCLYVYLTLDVEKAGGEWKTVRVERQRRVRRFEEDINVVDTDSALFQQGPQRLPSCTIAQSYFCRCRYRYRYR